EQRAHPPPDPADGRGQRVTPDRRRRPAVGRPLYRPRRGPRPHKGGHRERRSIAVRSRGSGRLLHGPGPGQAGPRAGARGPHDGLAHGPVLAAPHRTRPQGHGRQGRPLGGGHPVHAGTRLRVLRGGGGDGGAAGRPGEGGGGRRLRGPWGRGGKAARGRGLPRGRRQRPARGGPVQGGAGTVAASGGPGV
ncbi:MAG: Fumarate hydratase class I, beta region; L(+)-tartrate dehydratase beta subunit, partial [uncultured Rubrobacteraceae bacterium]